MLFVRRMKWKLRYIVTKTQYLKFSDVMKYQVKYFTGEKSLSCICFCKVTFSGGPLL